MGQQESNMLRTCATPGVRVGFTLLVAHARFPETHNIPASQRSHAAGVL
jgi:hypothetical protein